MSTLAVPEPAAAGPLASPAAPRARIDAVDWLRGLVMVVMLVDHTRDFFSEDLLRFDPSDLSQTYPALFLTRWITHFCAPVFVLLAGTGASLQLQRGKTKRELSRFLWTRGVWLVLLELTVIRVGTWFNLDYGSFLGMLQVIWAIGVGMVLLAALVHLPVRVVAGFGVGMVALHNLLDGVGVAPWQGPGSAVPSPLGRLWMLLHQPGATPAWEGGPVVLVLYPLVPWIGVMAAGYALGEVYRWDPARRRRFLLRAGAAMVAAFVAIRATNRYGDPSEWTWRGDALWTTLSFVNTTKYPPSLLFLLMTLGPALLALAWVEGTGRSAVGRALVTFGRVPLFFYVLQWYLPHAMAVLAGLAVGQDVAWLFSTPFARPYGNPDGVGFSLPVVWVMWAVGVLLLYLPCRWFAGVKARRKDWWLGYL